jgi:hypothetical protein
MWRALGVAVALAAARVAGAQDSLPSLALDRETSARLSRIVEEVRARGLPTDHVVSKIRFALVLHAPPPKIIAAAEAVAARLEAARAALAPRPVPTDIDAGEDALSFSVPRDALVAVRAAAPDQPVAVPLGVLTQLVTSGVPPKQAVAMVTELLKRGATPTQFAALGNDVDADVRRGAHPDAAADVRMRGLTAVLAPAATGAASPTVAATAPKRP